MSNMSTVSRFQFTIAFLLACCPSVQPSVCKLNIFIFFKTMLPLFNKKIITAMLLSSPEPKAQVSFSDQNLSVVRRRCCCRCRRYRKLFTFSSSSPEPLGQFQTWHKVSLGEGDSSLFK